jgi:hypothetical protein
MAKVEDRMVHNAWVSWMTVKGYEPIIKVKNFGIIEDAFKAGYELGKEVAEEAKR